jgi:hypothetical protein
MPPQGLFVASFGQKDELPGNIVPYDDSFGQKVG